MLTGYHFESKFSRPSHIPDTYTTLKQQFHETRMPNPATASMPFAAGSCIGLVGLDPGGSDGSGPLGGGLVGREPGGGGGRGALGGGAGGPKPTTGMPKSSSGREERVFRPLRMLVREPARGGRGDMARSGSGIAWSASSGTLGVVDLNPSAFS